MSTRWHTLGDRLREHARGRPAATATVCAGERWSYAELDARVDRLAGVLAGLGFKPGDRVLWLGQNCHRALESMLAAARLGGACCPANWRLSAAELAFVVADSAPAVVITQAAEIGDKLAEALAAAAYAGPAIVHDSPDPDGYEARLAAAAPPAEAVDVDPASAALLLYTAAFEGRPNGALISHDAVLAQAQVLAAAHAIDPDYVYLNAGPLFHVATLMLTAATFVTGGSNVFAPRPEPEGLLRLIAGERARGAFIVEPTLSRMVAANAGGRYDISCLLAPPATPEWNAMVDTQGSLWARRRGGYGQTEVFGMLTLRCLGGEGGAGRAVPVAEFRIVDPDGAEVATGGVGEIVARGPIVMLGYHNRPDLNAHRRRGGWHHTFDLGRREPDGSLTFVGPMGRMIKSGVENIYPAEVEACLNAHPGVVESAVIGVPDPVWKQSVKAVVVRAAGATVTEEELIEHCRARIGSYKKPRTVVFVDALPRSGGAIDHAAIDREHGGGGYPGEATLAPPARGGA